MRIPALMRKRLFISGILCLLFFTFSAILLFQYFNNLDAQPQPSVYAKERQVQGRQTQDDVQIATQVTEPTISITQAPSSTLQPPITEAPQIQVSEPPVKDVLSALNAYRKKNGVGELSIDTKLQEFAQSRADYFASTGSMDNHAGFQSMMNDNGFAKMGFNALGENSSFGAFGSAQNLIETIYGGHGPHDENQLNSDWTHVGIGIKDDATNLVFGGRKI